MKENKNSCIKEERKKFYFSLGPNNKVISNINRTINE